MGSEMCIRDRKLPNFPILEEAYREVLEDYMDVDNAIKVLKWVEEGKIDVKIIKSKYAPTPFSHNIIAHGYSDAVLMEDKRKLLIKLYEAVMRRLSREGGKGVN